MIYRFRRDRVNVEKYDPSSAKEKVRRKDKADRATMEQVMDPRTRMIVFKLLNRGAVREFNGCISTGKEANVYHCTMGEGENGAVKIYKTSILVFKDRSDALKNTAQLVLIKIYFQGQVRHRRVPVQAGLREEEPSQDGSHVGGEGDAQPDAAAQRGRPLPAADPAAVARAAHGLHRQRGRLARPAAQGRRAELLQGAGALLGPLPHRQKDIPRLQVST